MVTPPVEEGENRNELEDLRAERVFVHEQRLHYYRSWRLEAYSA